MRSNTKNVSRDAGGEIYAVWYLAVVSRPDDENQSNCRTVTTQNDD